MEDPAEIEVSPPFRAESLEDFLVVDEAGSLENASFLTGPRSETGAGELDKLERGEEERAGVVASAVLREK